MVSSALTGLVGAALALALAVGPTLLSDTSGLRFMLGLGGGDLVVITTASGLYDTASGKPVYFVRGRVENRGKRVSGPVRVVAQLVGDSGGAAQGQTIAGIEPTAEDVYALRSSAEADKLMKALALKISGERRLPPGGSLPFFALFADPPPEVQRQRLLVGLEAAEPSPPAGPAKGR